MALNGSGIRDTARVLKISPTTVINELKNDLVERNAICDGSNSSESAIIAFLGGATVSLLEVLTPFKNMVQGYMRT